VSDLQCPATLIVARHAEATYDDPDILNDYGGWLTDLGRKQAAELAERVADRRIAAVWCSELSRSVQTAEIVSARLEGPPVRVRRGLHEVPPGALVGQPVEVFDSYYLPWLEGELDQPSPLGETGRAVLERMTAVLQDAADLFRGETVLIVSHGAAIGLALPYLAHNVPRNYAHGRGLHNCATCEVTVDGDGWKLLTWAGEPI
jgi:broad specificity phosphatase PhoE